MRNAIELQDIVVEGETGGRLLELSLVIAAGEWVVGVGPNRSGKSVMLEVCAGLISPGRGSVRVLGHDLGQLDEEALRELRLRLGVVLQQPGLLSNMTVFNNVALPLRYHQTVPESDIPARVMPVLEELDLGSIATCFPAQLSPGEVRRVALARALILNPELLLLDEPILGLDAEHVRRLAELLDRRRRARPLTIVSMVSGWSPLVDRADRVAVLRDGRLEAFGPRSELLATAAGRQGYLT
jgi:ABC-type transporter Mla maintaining outer membrane lipid asymmetry ATPase subunit MlaF